LNVKAVIAGLLILCTLSGFAQVSAEWQWASRAGGTGGTGGGDVDDQAWDIVVDNEGNSYVVGNVFQSGFATFDTTSVPTYGDRDIFIAKYDCEGKLEWVKTGGNRQNDVYEQFIEIDTVHRKIYYIGAFISHALLSFTFANDTIITDENSSLFVWQFEYDGTLNWMFNSGTEALPLATDFDQEGNLHFCFSADSGLFASGHNLNAGLHYAVIQDNGIIQSITDVTTSGYVIFNDMKIDNKHNIYIAGGFQDTITIAGQQLIAQGYEDGYMLKLDSVGNFEWVKQISAQPGQFMGFTNLAVLEEDNFYVTASGAGVINFGSLSFNIGMRSNEGMLIHYKNAVPVWGKHLKSANTAGNALSALALDHQKNLYVSGRFLRSATFDGITLTDIGTGPVHEILIAKFDSLDNLSYAFTVPGSGDDQIRALETGYNGNLYAAGYFGTDLEFSEDTILTNGGVSDIFVAKFGIPQCADTTSPWIGIADVLGVENQHLLLYPNPTGGQFTIEADLNSSGGMLTVYNSVGQVIHQRNIKKAGLYKESIDLNVEHGIYFVQLDAGAERYSQKLIIR
jgi:hypothetical protein